MSFNKFSFSLIEIFDRALLVSFGSVSVWNSYLSSEEVVLPFHFEYISHGSLMESFLRGGDSPVSFEEPHLSVSGVGDGLRIADVIVVSSGVSSFFNRSLPHLKTTQIFN